MRILLICLALLALFLGAAWYGGETWLSRVARDMAASGSGFTAAEVAPLRNPTRIGLRLDGVEIGDSVTGLSAPDLDVYAPISAPNTMVLSLPQTLGLRIGSVPVQLGLDAAEARASVAPTHEMAVRRAGVEARGVTLDGSPLLDDLSVQAKLAHMGTAAPRLSRAAYALMLAVDGLSLAGLTQKATLGGPVQLWLSEVPGQAMLEGRVPPPALTGIQTTGLRLSLGPEIEARLIGRIEADQAGFAAGEMALYTTDADAFIQAAVQAGLLPQDAAMMAGTLLNNLSETPVGADDSAAPVTPMNAEEQALDTATAAPDADLVVSLPPAADGEIRLPLILRDGQARLGNIPIGPAPRLSLDPATTRTRSGSM
ncbi:DUF2125 domain-containing protein [Paracoccus aurantiacus]|uniref:DUF2125 domain-containing protein n=1 Tax=Paracoccus aurantiacus TaxID=2599412 RepID=A0A5C6SAF8_9RHOB|nr:DUF2125 domain-containing protein [Paracoccus aurantiacus]TXB70575.1 DUF2125 domain-containing protein [Paracoccus aurantiacus]